MEEKSLSIAFGDSLKSEVIACASDYLELGLDAITNEGILKEIPFVSTVVALYKIGDSIKERHNFKKLIVFINEINKGIVDEEKRRRYQEKFEKNEKFRNEELEYLYVLIDRYIDYDKPRMLAKLYLAYLDGILIWQEFTMYAEVIDRFLFLDCNRLVSDSDKTIIHRNKGGEPILRLAALGLMIEITDTSSYVSDGKGGYALTWQSLARSQSLDKIYQRTEFGEKLAKILR